LNLGVLQNLVDPRLLDVEDLAAQRQDGLRVAVAGPALAEPPAGVTLDDEQLGPAMDPSPSKSASFARQRRVLPRPDFAARSGPAPFARALARTLGPGRTS